MIQLDVISDPVCPWCYIGKVRLDRAIAETGSNPFVRTWRMFRLNPDMKPEGMDRRTYLEQKFGGPEGAAKVYGAIAETADAEGMDLALDRISRTPQTLDAHRVIRWATAEGLEAPVTEAIFDAYFRGGADISEHDVLASLAGAAGMDEAMVRRLLAGDADREDLVAEELEARKMGVTGVPCFIIGGRHVVQGAQDTATWVRIITELSAALEKQASSEDASVESGP